MKLTNVETAWMHIPSPRPQGVSGGQLRQSSDAICRITTSDGIRGVGEGRGAPLDEICRIVDQVFRPLLEGENPLHTQYLWDKCYHATHDADGTVKARYEVGSVRGALCAVDIALWDIKAQAAGMSVCELLGGKPHPVPAYIQKGFYVDGQTLEDMTDEALQVLEAGGYRYLKMRVGRNGIQEAVDRVEAMRRALGDEVGLMVDVNQAWEPADALEGARALEPFDLVWLEEPIRRHRHDASEPVYDWNEEMGKLSQQTAIPLAAGENHNGLCEFYQLATKGGIRYMQVDVAKQSGGVSEWVKVVGMCQAAGILMAPHLVPQFHVHLVAAASNGFIVECGDDELQHPSWPDLFHGWPRVTDGHVACPTEPGWGLTINEAMLRKHATVVRWTFDG